MASLKNGVLIKLLEDIKNDDKDAMQDEDPKPVLLQIRRIIPVLEEGDLFPNRGFYLKVSDSSHALDVSLTEEQNEMIMGNKLKLGQFIYAQKLEKSNPLPLLRGVTPVPGRRPCEGAPEDISNHRLHDASSTVDPVVVEKGVILEKKVSKDSSVSRELRRGFSDSESSSLPGKRSEGSKGGKLRSSSASRVRVGEKCTFKAHDFERGCCGDVMMWPRSSRPSSVDNDSDADSVVSSASSSVSRTWKRRSWNESEILGVKEIFDSSVGKNEIRLPPRSRSANVSPVRSVRYDSSDDNSSSTTRRRSVGSAKRLINNSSKQSQEPLTKGNDIQMSNSLCSLVYDRKGAETGISWNSLPPNLVKFGKEVTRQRDIALHAAANALQEACASERLLNSLSTLSQFPLAEGDDLQPYVDKFFDLRDDLARTRLIMQSLTSITPFRTQETDQSCPTNSIKETLTTALERKKNAITWIKSAIALDLSPCPSPPLANPMEATNTLKKKTSPCSNKNNKPKGSYIVKKNRTSMDILPLISASDKEDQPEWTRGSTLSAAADLAMSLQDECRKLFLSYVEKYLDEVERKSSSMESNDQMAGMMYRVKIVSDWLNVIVNKDGNIKDGGRNESCAKLEDSEIEAYERVRNKIYGILLKHVERTAMAFERLKATI